jgi:hypothetical protein
VPNYNNSPNFVAYNTRLTCGTCCSVGHLFLPSCPLLSPTSIPNVYCWSHAEGARPPAHAEGARPPAAGACGGSSTSCRRRRRRVETELDRRHARRELDLTCGGVSTAGARGGDGSWRDFVCGHLIFPARADPGAVARARVAGGEDAAQPASVVEQRRGGAGGARWVVAVPRSRHHGSPPSNQLVAGEVRGRGWIARSLAVGVLEFLCHLCGDPGGVEEQGPAADVQGRRG